MRQQNHSTDEPAVLIVVDPLPAAVRAKVISSCLAGVSQEGVRKPARALIGAERITDAM